jgi:hypothetical protein
MSPLSTTSGGIGWEQLPHPGGRDMETDADVLDETLSLDRVPFAVEPAKHLRLVFLDACRAAAISDPMPNLRWVHRIKHPGSSRDPVVQKNYW